MWQITSFEFRGKVFGSFASMALTLKYNDGSQVDTSYEFPAGAGLKPHHLIMARELYRERKAMADAVGAEVTDRLSEKFKTLINQGA